MKIVDFPFLKSLGQRRLVGHTLGIKKDKKIPVLLKRMCKNDIKSDTNDAGCVQLVHAQCLFLLDIKKQSSALALANRLAAE